MTIEDGYVELVRKAGFDTVRPPVNWSPHAAAKASFAIATDLFTGPRVLIDDMAAVVWTGRRVYLIFYSNAALNPLVLAAEKALAEALTAAGAVVLAIRLPAGKNGEKQGLDDVLARHGKDALDHLLATADAKPTPPDGGDGKGPNTADLLVALACSHTELWHDPAQTAFASIGRRATPVRKAFRHWLNCRHRAAYGGKVPNADALTNAAHAIEAQAVIDGPEREAHVRVAHHAGRVVERPTGCRDEQAARQMLAGWEREAERIRAGTFDPGELDIARRAATPVADHLAAYEQTLITAGTTPATGRTCGGRWNGWRRTAGSSRWRTSPAARSNAGSPPERGTG